MLRFAQREAVDKTAIQALGVLGDPATFPTLLAALSDENVALHAARALHWITGAAMFVESNLTIMNQRITNDSPRPVEDDAQLISDLFIRGLKRRAR